MESVKKKRKSKAMIIQRKKDNLPDTKPVSNIELETALINLADQIKQMNQDLDNLFKRLGYDN